MGDHLCRDVARRTACRRDERVDHFGTLRAVGEPDKEIDLGDTTIRLSGDLAAGSIGAADFEWRYVDGQAHHRLEHCVMSGGQLLLNGTSGSSVYVANSTLYKIVAYGPSGWLTGSVLYSSIVSFIGSPEAPLGLTRSLVTDSFVTGGLFLDGAASQSLVASQLDLAEVMIVGGSPLISLSNIRLATVVDSASTFVECNMVNSVDGSVVLRTRGSDTITVDAQFSFWGHAATTDMVAGRQPSSIEDAGVDPTAPRVAFSNFALEAIEKAGPSFGDSFFGATYMTPSVSYSAPIIAGDEGGGRGSNLDGAEDGVVSAVLSIEPLYMIIGGVCVILVTCVFFAVCCSNRTKRRGRVVPILPQQP